MVNFISCSSPLLFITRSSNYLSQPVLEIIPIDCSLVPPALTSSLVKNIGRLLPLFLPMQVRLCWKSRVQKLTSPGIHWPVSPLKVSPSGFGVMFDGNAIRTDYIWKIQDKLQESSLPISLANYSLHTRCLSCYWSHRLVNTIKNSSLEDVC